MMFSSGKCLSAYTLCNVASLCPLDASTVSFYSVSGHSYGHGALFRVESRKGSKNRLENTYSRAWFPEAVLLKKKKPREDGRLLPDFADVEEEKTYDKLLLDLQNSVDVKAMRHYEVIYLIAEERDHELEAVREMIRKYISVKEGKVWREGDWGIRLLAYKIKRHERAHYSTMNIELESKWVNEFKYMLEKDERVIRYLVIRRYSPNPDYCLPPPGRNDKTIRRGYKAMIPEDWGDDDDDDEEEDDDDDGSNKDDDEEDNIFDK